MISAGNKGQLDLMLHFHGTLIPFDGSLLLSSGLEVVLVELRTILKYSVFVHEPHIRINSEHVHRKLNHLSIQQSYIRKLTYVSYMS